MKTTQNKVKEALIGILLAGLIALVPFYFETKAMTEDNYHLNVQQEQQINLLDTEQDEIRVNQALEKLEILHQKEILLRIEKKLDELRAEIKPSN